MKSFLFFLLCAVAFPLAAQTPTFDDLVIEEDSAAAAYKASGKNYIILKSKRGSGGMNKTSSGDSIKSFEITDIVLVYTEDNPSDLENRETYNRERWENLLSTYPEFFQFSTNYKNFCQQGASEIFKQKQGFYIYFKGKQQEVAKTEQPKAEEKKAEEKVAKEEKKQPESRKEEKKEEKKSEKENKKEEIVKKEEKKKEEPVENTQSSGGGEEKTETLSEADFKSKPKKEGFSKPRRSKDPKGCRPPCYEGGDDDLNNFFKDQIQLTKKEKRHKSDLVCVVRIQLNFDGSIKKAMVQGTNEMLNTKVTGAIKAMNNWNPAVKAGITVKSEVKFTLKYDKPTKAMRPSEFSITPRPNPKCQKCISDSEMFAD
jgi:flagellar biosynthesis GTPase FlhF